MPFRANAERRHHILRQRHRATNSVAYDAALRQCGSLTVWFTHAAIAAWKAEPRITRGDQSRYSVLAIATALTLRSVFRLALRQTEGLIGSIITLLGLELAVPDYTTLSRLADGLGRSSPSAGLQSCAPANQQHGAEALRLRVPHLCLGLVRGTHLGRRSIVPHQVGRTHDRRRTAIELCRSPLAPKGSFSNRISNVNWFLLLCVAEPGSRFSSRSA